MRAHVARGERGMAIQAYDRCRAVLADLLDAAPSQETQKLLAEIRGPYGSRVPVRPAPPPAPPVQAAPPPPPPIEDEHDEPVAVLEPRQDLRNARGGAHVGVLPMQFPGASDEEAHLGPGLAEEITTALSRFRWMFVVASSSLARFAAETRDEGAIRRTFGIDFLVDGSIQRVRNRLRITVRLLDLRAGNQVVWARRFDRQTNDLLTLQDEIAAEVVAQIDPEILLIEARRSATRPPVDATAYDLVLRAIPLMWPDGAGAVHAGRRASGARHRAGTGLRRRAMPGTPTGTCSWSARAGRTIPGAMIEQAGTLAERAIVLDPFDARGLTIAGHVRAFLHHRLREAIACTSARCRSTRTWRWPGPVWRCATPIWASRRKPNGGTTATRSCRRSIRTHFSTILLHHHPSAQAGLRIGGGSGAGGDAR